MDEEALTWGALQRDLEGHQPTPDQPVEIYDTAGNRQRLVGTYVEDGILCLDIERAES